MCKQYFAVIEASCCQELQGTFAWSLVCSFLKKSASDFRGLAAFCNVNNCGLSVCCNQYCVSYSATATLCLSHGQQQSSPRYTSESTSSADSWCWYCLLKYQQLATDMFNADLPYLMLHSCASWHLRIDLLMSPGILTLFVWSIASNTTYPLVTCWCHQLGGELRGCKKPTLCLHNRLGCRNFKSETFVLTYADLDCNLQFLYAAAKFLFMSRRIRPLL